jgi:hypothetical protein
VCHLLGNRKKMKKKKIEFKIYASRFRISLILLGAFYAFRSLGAGSSKRTRKPLGAHQGRF